MVTLEKVRVKELKITQTKAAQLLGVSKNTWIRWEKGKFGHDEDVADLLRGLARNERPPACIRWRFPPQWDWAKFELHLAECDQCQLLVKYLATIVKVRRSRKSKF